MKEVSRRPIDQTKQRTLHRPLQPTASGLAQISRVTSTSTKRILSGNPPYVNKTPIIFVGINAISEESLCPLPEEVPLVGHDQVPTGAGGRFEGVAADHGHGYTGGLGHHQLGRGGDLVGHGEDAGFEWVAMRVSLAAVVGEGVNSRYADGDVG